MLKIFQNISKSAKLVGFQHVAALQMKPQMFTSSFQSQSRSLMTTNYALNFSKMGRTSLNLVGIFNVKRVNDQFIRFSSTMKKRRMKMNKHKLKKRRKLLRMNTKASREI
jgi:hypothetical protein